MQTPRITAHAETRMTQRGIARAQLEHGEPDGDKIVLSARDARALIEVDKAEVRRLDAVVKKGGVTAVLVGETLVTTYRTTSYAAPKCRRLGR